MKLRFEIQLILVVISTLTSVASAGLLHEYEFLGNGDDSVGTANGVVGAQVGFDPNVPLALQQAAVFPNFVGAPGQITAANVTELGTGDYSIAFWVRRDLNQFFHGIADSFDNSSSTDGGWEAFIFPLDIVALRVEDVNGNQDVYATSSTITDNCWHHVAVSVDRDDPNGVKWYVDGAFDSSQNPTFVSGSIESNLGTMIIGSLDAGAGLSGALGLVQIYDHALNVTEVQNLYAFVPEDEDNDGVLNCDDICQGFDDALDTDGDGIPDGCDACEGNNASGDTDADGVCDDMDICPGFDDTVDNDSDGVPDGCDICPGFDDTADSDGDGIPNGCDTQPVHNLTQATDYYGLQDAIDAAVNDDIIEADPQTYFESIDFLGKAIILRSNSGDPNNTLIDGTGHFHVVQCVSGEDPNTILQGFTITGGNANGSSPNNDGGGMYNVNSSPTVNHCIFKNNLANVSGGGMYNESSSPTVNQCTFEDNIATLEGGGMYNSASSPEINDCIFKSNQSALTSGGAIFNGSSSLTITNCLFDSNLASGGLGNGGGMDNSSSNIIVNSSIFKNNMTTGLGGGMHTSDGSLTMNQCTFENNMATQEGGGMANTENSLEINNCIFKSNQTDISGGAIFDSESNSTTITDCFFDNNLAIQNGGGIYNSGSNLIMNSSTFTNNKTMGDPNNNVGDGGGMSIDGNGSVVLTNSIFSNNLVTNEGGGVFALDASDIQIINCTFAMNVAVSSGGGLSNEFGDPNVANSIFWQNSDTGGMDESAQIHVNSGTLTVSYSNIMGGWSGAGTGNINADPLFVDADGLDNDPNTFADNDYRLAAGSPCIDAGDPNLVPADTFDLDDDSDTSEHIPFDLAGRIRIVDDLPTTDTGINGPPVVDMGAYEHQCDGNLDAIGSVNIIDFSLFTQLWLNVDCGFCGGADFDGDDDVTLSDGLIQWTNWLCGI